MVFVGNCRFPCKKFFRVFLKIYETNVPRILDNVSNDSHGNTWKNPSGNQDGSSAIVRERMLAENPDVNSTVF